MAQKSFILVNNIDSEAFTFQVPYRVVLVVVCKLTDVLQDVLHIYDLIGEIVGVLTNQILSSLFLFLLSM